MESTISCNARTMKRPSFKPYCLVKRSPASYTAARRWGFNSFSKSFPVGFNIHRRRYVTGNLRSTLRLLMSTRPCVFHCQGIFLSLGIHCKRLAALEGKRVISLSKLLLELYLVLGPSYLIAATSYVVRTLTVVTSGIFLFLGSVSIWMLCPTCPITKFDCLFPGIAL